MVLTSSIITKGVLFCFSLYTLNNFFMSISSDFIGHKLMFSFSVNGIFRAKNYEQDNSVMTLNQMLEVQNKSQPWNERTHNKESVTVFFICICMENIQA
jgi:hypothetical protein